MKLQVTHIPTSSLLVTSDNIAGMTYEELFTLVKKVSTGDITCIHMYVGGNTVFFPAKILAESAITIIKD